MRITGETSTQTSRTKRTRPFRRFVGNYSEPRSGDSHVSPAIAQSGQSETVRISHKESQITLGGIKVGKTRNSSIQLPLKDRFWAKVNKNGPSQPHCMELGNCWEWTAALDGRGYGVIQNGGRGEPLQRAHRVAFFLEYGRWPEPCALHKCDNRACVRIDHIFEGTKKDNAIDTHSKGRANLNPNRGERHHNAKLTEAQVVKLKEELRTDKRQRILAAEYGISRRNVQAIKYGESWTHTINQKER